MKFIGPMIHTGQFLRWLAPKGDAVRETHILAPATHLQETIDWLRWRGYRAIVCGTASGGMVFSRKNEPATVAVVGDVLVWDGQEVRVED